jgi:hypothetical protein
MNRKAKELRSALALKGFSLERKTTDDLFYFYFGGKKTQVHTKISMGRGEELRAALLSKIRTQLCLDTNAQLGDFIDCPMTHELYIRHLQSKGILEKQPKTT